MMANKRLWALLYAVVLAAFTCYTALDTFVIPRAYASVAPAEGSVRETDAAAADGGEGQTQSGGGTDGVFSAEAVVTDSSYSDQNISVTLTEYRVCDSTVYVAEVLVSSPEYLKTALAQNTYGRNITQTTSQMAQTSGAILAINGDYYGSQTKGYVIRNGVLYRETASEGREDLVIWEDGSFSVITEGEVSAAELLENGAWQVLSFGPALVADGEVSVTEDQEVGKAKASNPRTAVGILDACHYLFVVSDGRTQESAGLSLYQLAQFMQELGADTAYNLDGGGSSTMVFNGTVVNNPTSNGKTIQERSVSDIVYVG